VHITHSDIFSISGWEVVDETIARMAYLNPIRSGTASGNNTQMHILRGQRVHAVDHAIIISGGLMKSQKEKFSLLWRIQSSDLRLR
jgi:hypothetical protein